MAEPITLSSDHKSMNMERFYCDTFELGLRFEAGEMDIEAFLKDVNQKGINTEPDEDGDREVSVAFRTDDDATDEYHAHLTVRVRKDGSGRADLSYHRGDVEKAIQQPPTVDNCAEWLGRFFADEVTAPMHVNYTFPKSFVPTVSLNFPLTTSEKALAGTVVSGMALKLPGEPRTTAIIQSGKNGETYLFVRKTIRLDLRQFDLAEELERQTPVVNALIRKPE